MKIVINEDELEHVIDIFQDMPDNKILLDHCLDGAIECEADAICDGDEVRIMASCSTSSPPVFTAATVMQSCYNLGDLIISQIQEYTKRIALAGNSGRSTSVCRQGRPGVHHRSQPACFRTVPFIAKAYGEPYVNHATKVMMGEAKLKDLPHNPKLDGYAVKFLSSRTKFPEVNKELGPEMKSTGEGIRFIPDLWDPFFRKV